jgi:RHS repeat-associated protein
MNQTALIFSFLLLTIFAAAQPNNAYLKNVTMPSPQAASLGKYGDIPVGYYTGVPNVGIPFYTLSDGPLSLPVSLSYHASGLKVAETPSWVGLNWTLSAGGMVSRTVQSYKDEAGGAGWLYSAAIPQNPTPNGSGGWNGDYCGFYTHVNSGDKDSEPDLFSFSFPGGSGKFYFTKAGAAVLVPVQQLKITPQFSASTSDVSHLKGFVITTPDGTKYAFGDTGDGSPAIETTIGGGGDYPEIPSSWYLKKIESADGNYAINLNYADECSETDYRPSTVGCDGSAPGGDPVPNLARKSSFVKGKRISSITTTTETAIFTPGAVREDLDIYPVSPFNIQTPKTLASVSISSGSFQKKFDFTYNYWVDNSADSVTTGSIKANKRLRLLSVQEKSGDGVAIVNPAWSFEYFTKTGSVDFLPHRLSRSIDHWGFYNAADNGVYNTSTPNIPGTLSGTCLNGGSCNNNTFTYAGSSNRETNETAMKYGTLKKVNYPTGGYTEFDFEANDYYSSNPGTQIITVLDISHNYSGGGICGSISNVGTPNPVTISATDLPLLKYNWALKPANCTCSGGQVSMEIRVYNTSNALVATSGQLQVNCTNTAGSTGTGNLTAMFPTLPAGAYRFEIFGVNAAAKFFITKETTIPAGNVKVGGLRVKQITTYDGINTTNNLIRTYTYRDSVNTTRSSGQLYNKPNYVHSYTWYPCLPQGQGCHGSNSVCAPGTCPLYQLPSGGCNVNFYENSIVPMSSFEGYHIGYQHVKEDFNTNGYKTYTYTKESAFANQYPNPPAPARILAGNLIHAVTRSTSGGLIASESHTAYSENYVNSTDVMYKKTQNNCGSFLTVYTIRTRSYREASVKNVLDGVETKTTYTYSPNTNYDVINNHLFPVSQSVTNSDGKVHTTEFKYPYDAVTGNSAIMADLKTRYIVADPWKTIIKVDNAEVDGTEIDYAWFSPLGVKQSTQSGNFPRFNMYSNFEVTWTSDTLTGPGKTLRGTIESYSNKGLPTSFTAANWLPETYTWATNGLISTKTYNGYVTSYTYNSGTKLVSKITQPDGQESWFDYDQLMRVVKAWARPSTAGTKTTATVTTDYDYRYRSQVAPTNPLLENYVKTVTTFATAPTGGGTSGLTTQEGYQYMDGIGRPYQSVARKQSPAQKDVVIYTTYDKWGRTVKQYNPVESTTNTGGKIAEPTSAPYTLSEYYSDPLSRPWKVTPPSWYATEYTYGANIANEVLLNHTTPTYYDANSLSKTTLKDPDNKQVITYKDKMGRNLLTKRTNTANAGPANTYNIYDDKDRMVKVIPPGSTFASTTLNFEYTYDPADNMLTKKVPDAALVTMKYNTRDQLALEQDGNLLAQSKWRCMQYDDYGRVLKTGLYSGAVPSPIPTTMAPTDLYTENIYGTTGIEKGKVKTAKVKVFDTPPNWLQSTNTFDTYGRISSSTGNNYLQLTDFSAETMSYIYDYADNVLKDTRVSKKTAAISYTLTQTHNYDHWGRNTLNTHQVGTGTIHNISQINYDWKNQVTEKNLGKTPSTTNYLQSLDYAYNDQGWLTTINAASLGGTNTGLAACPTNQGMPSPGAASTTPDLNDLFYLELKYDVLQSGLTGTAVKNGNISQVLWRVRGRERQAYSLTYDYLDRMTNARYDNISDAGTVNNTSAWDENLVYDIRGNINSLTRTGKYKTLPSATCWTDGQIDALTYTYNTNTNKLQKIADAAPAASKTNGWNNPAAAPGTAQYTYDANGNMTFDPYKNLGIEYNFLNLPKKMTFSLPSGAEQTIDILYDGSGRKLRKTVKDAGSLVYTQDYVGGIEYRTTLALSLSLESIGHGEGRVFNTNTGTTSADALRYEYSIKDHLGNTRLTFTDKNSDGKVDITTTGEVLQENHYYPFGLAMSGPWMNDAAIDNKYQYNGKEINDDFGLGWNDYGARWYDATVGRWWSVDLMAEKTLFNNPYHYVNNNPLLHIDPTGMFGVTYGAAGYSSTSEYFNETYKAQQEAFSADNNKKEDGSSSQLPTLYIVNKAGVSVSDMIKINEHVNEIFEKNGISGGVKFEIVSEDIAKTFDNSYPGQMFLAFINVNDKIDPGCSSDGKEGKIGVYNKYNIANGSLGWSSYVNFNDSKIVNYKGDINYARAYFVTHEIIHQLALISSWKEGKILNVNHDNKSLNIMQQGIYLSVPKYRKGKLDPRETIPDSYKEFLDYYKFKP